MTEVKEVNTNVNYTLSLKKNIKLLKENGIIDEYGFINKDIPIDQDDERNDDYCNPGIFRYYMIKGDKTFLVGPDPCNYDIVIALENDTMDGLVEFGECYPNVICCGANKIDKAIMNLLSLAESSI